MRDRRSGGGAAPVSSGNNDIFTSYYCQLLIRLLWSLFLDFYIESFDEPNPKEYIYSFIIYFQTDCFRNLYKLTSEPGIQEMFSCIGLILTLPSFSLALMKASSHSFFLSGVSNAILRVSTPSLGLMFNWMNEAWLSSVACLSETFRKFMMK